MFCPKIIRYMCNFYLQELSPPPVMRWMDCQSTSRHQTTPPCPLNVPRRSPFSDHHTLGLESFAAENNKSPSRLYLIWVMARSCPCSIRGFCKNMFQKWHSFLSLQSVCVHELCIRWASLLVVVKYHMAYHVLCFILRTIYCMKSQNVRILEIFSGMWRHYCWDLRFLKEIVNLTSVNLTISSFITDY